MVKNRKSVRYIWLRSFVYLLMIVMAVFLASSIWMRHLIEKDVTDLNYNTSVFIQNIIDTRLNELKNLSYQIIYNQENIVLSNSRDPEDFATPQSYEFTNYIKNFIIANSFLQDIYIYYPKTDYIVGNYGNYSSKNYYRLLNNLSENGYRQWMNIFTDSPNKRFFITDTGSGTSLFLRTNIPAGDSSDQPVLIAKMKVSEVNNILRWSNTQYPHSMVAMLDNSNHIYTSVGEEGFMDSIKDQLAGLNGNFVYSGDKILVIEPSNIGQFKYLLIYKKSDVLKVVYSTTYILVFACFCCLLVGLVLSVYFSAKNSHPLIALVRRICFGPVDESKNEYDLLDQRITGMLDESRSAMQRIERQQTLLNQSFVSILLRENYRNNQTVQMLCNVYSISFDFLYFQVAVIRMRPPQNGKLIPAWEKLIRERNFRETAVIFSEMEEAFVFVINTEDNNGQDSRTFVTEAADFAATTDPNARVGVGRAYDSMSDISLSYDEALSALESKGRVSYYEGSSLQTVSFFEHGETMLEFQRSLEDREYDKAIAAIPALFSDYLSNANAHIVRCRKYAIINQVLEAECAELRAYGNPTPLRNGETANSDLLFTSATLPALKGNIVTVLQNLKRFADPQNESSISVAHKARNMIDSRYADPMLGLYSIADTLGVSNSYLSKVFKAEYGIGLVKYINQVRIGKAKELIVAGDMSVKNVAFSVGFSSDVSFIRAFKRQEHTTPGKFKNR